MILEGLDANVNGIDIFPIQMVGCFTSVFRPLAIRVAMLPFDAMFNRIHKHRASDVLYTLTALVLGKATNHVKNRGSCLEMWVLLETSVLRRSDLTKSYLDNCSEQGRAAVSLI